MRGAGAPGDRFDMAAILNLARLTGAIVNIAAAALLVALILILSARGFVGASPEEGAAGLPFTPGAGLLPGEPQ